MEDEIVRHSMPYKSITKPKLFSPENFIEFDELKKQNNFQKWFNGINPKTSRKLIINGKTHYHIGEELGFINYEKLKNYDFYLELINIKDINKYIYDANEIMQKYEKDCIEAKKYNDYILTVMDTVNELKWNEFIIVDGIKYGKQEVNYGIHNTNDCGGEMIRGQIYECYCDSSRCWRECTSSPKYDYCCDKCNFTRRGR